LNVDGRLRRELTALVQKVTTETAEPVKAGITKAFKTVA
jgi:hypothetical protein